MTRQSSNESRDSGHMLIVCDFLPSRRPSEKARNFLAERALRRTIAGVSAKNLGLTSELNDKQEGESDVSADRP
jgi:hypothetical protein